VERGVKKRGRRGLETEGGEGKEWKGEGREGGEGKGKRIRVALSRVYTRYM